MTTRSFNWTTILELIDRPGRLSLATLLELFKFECWSCFLALKKYPHYPTKRYQTQCKVLYLTGKTVWIMNSAPTPPLPTAWPLLALNITLSTSLSCVITIFGLPSSSGRFCCLCCCCCCCCSCCSSGRIFLPPPLLLRPEVLALKHESRIIGQPSNPVFGSRKSQASSPWAKQHIV